MYRQQAKTLSLIMWLHNSLFLSEKIKTKDEGKPAHRLCILKWNFCFEVNSTLRTMWLVTLYMLPCVTLDTINKIPDYLNGTIKHSDQLKGVRELETWYHATKQPPFSWDCTHSRFPQSCKRNLNSAKIFVTFVLVQLYQNYYIR